MRQNYTIVIIIVSIGRLSIGKLNHLEFFSLNIINKISIFFISVSIFQGINVLSNNISLAIIISDVKIFSDFCKFLNISHISSFGRHPHLVHAWPQSLASVISTPSCSNQNLGVTCQTSFQNNHWYIFQEKHNRG